MKNTAIFAAYLLLSSAAWGQAPGFSLNVKGIEENKAIPAQFAFCQPDGMGKTKDGGNINPEISWKNPPEGTKSFALIMVDPDVPASFDDANKEGKTLPADMPRQDFYHWVLVDIPARLNKINEAADSSGMKAGGKPVGKTAYGINGQNDYATFMQGTYGGYDGPCPPWNDERLHHYHFRLYALGVESLGLSGPFGGKQAMEAIGKHSLGQAQFVGTYSNKR